MIELSLVKHHPFNSACEIREPSKIWELPLHYYNTPILFLLPFMTFNHHFYDLSKWYQSSLPCIQSYINYTCISIHCSTNTVNQLILELRFIFAIHFHDAWKAWNNEMFTSCRYYMYIVYDAIYTVWLYYQQIKFVNISPLIYSRVRPH